MSYDYQLFTQAWCSQLTDSKPSRAKDQLMTLVLKAEQLPTLLAAAVSWVGNGEQEQRKHWLSSLYGFFHRVLHKENVCTVFTEFEITYTYTLMARHRRKTETFTHLIV